MAQEEFYKIRGMQVRKSAIKGRSINQVKATFKYLLDSKRILDSDIEKMHEDCGGKKPPSNKEVDKK